MNSTLIAVVSPSDVVLIERLLDALHEDGVHIVRLANLGVIAFLLASQRIGAVIVHEDRLPLDWEAMHKRMTKIAPTTRIVVVARDEQRTLGQLAEAVRSDSS